MRTGRRQRGWVGLIVILLALAVVALLGRTVLREMGLLGVRPPVAQTGEPGRPPSGAQPAAEPASAMPSSAAPIDRARAVEDMVLQGAAERGRQVDAGAK